MVKLDMRYPNGHEETIEGRSFELAIAEACNRYNEGIENDEFLAFGATDLLKHGVIFEAYW